MVYRGSGLGVLRLGVRDLRFVGEGLGFGAGCRVGSMWQSRWEKGLGFRV